MRYWEGGAYSCRGMVPLCTKCFSTLSWLVWLGLYCNLYPEMGLGT